MNLSEYIKTLEIGAGQSQRLDCPRCNGKNTLSVTNAGDHYVWNCFKASCRVKGSSEKKISQTELVSIFTKTTENGVTELILPDHFISCTRHQPALDYLKKNNCIQIYSSVSYVRPWIMYDLKLDRVVFLIRQNNKFVDGAGRRLSPAMSPKWLRYGKTHLPFYVPSHTPTPELVLVEDAASACSVSRIFNSLALLGTHLSDDIMGIIADIKPQYIYIALDADATPKSFSIQRQLELLYDTQIVILNRDLKYEEANTIKKIFSDA